MQSWLVTIRVTDDGADVGKGDETEIEYSSENEIRDEILSVNDLSDGLEITDITDIVKEK